MGDLSTNTRSDLSHRGQEISIQTEAGTIWHVIKNLWDPDTNPDGYVSLGVAENSLMHDELAAYIEKNFALPKRYLTYNDGGAGSIRLQTALARFLTRQLKPVKPILAEHICVTNGCSAAIEHATYLTTDPGEVILLGQPHYMAFLYDIQLRPHAKVATVAFGDVDPFSVEGVGCYEKVIQQCQQKQQIVKGLMLCHPHNPTGKCYSREAIVELMKLCQKYRIHLISDEIYALSVWENKEHSNPPPTPFVSVSSIDTTGLIDPYLVHLIWGMSKDFGANGLRMGALISQANPDFIQGCAAMAIFSYASGLTDYMTATILEDDAFIDSYIEKNSQKLSHHYSLAIQFLEKHDIEYIQGANAAFFIVADLLTPYKTKNGVDTNADDAELTKFLFRKFLSNKVFVVGSDQIGAEKPGWFRIVFSQDKRNLMEGLDRIMATIEGR